MKGKLAESWEVDPNSQWVRFKLREGVKSNWGNELTAEDVVWTWHRKLELGAIGGFFANTISLKRKEQIKAEDKYVVSFNLDHPNPLLLKLQPNLYNPIYDSTKCQEAGGSDDPWAKEFLKNETAGFGPYVVEQLTRGAQAVYKARDDYYGGKPAMETVILREVPTSANRAQLLQGGAVDIAQYLQPLELVQLASTPGVSVDTVRATFKLLIELNAKIPPLRQHRRAARDELRLPAGAGDLDRVPEPGEPADRLHARHLSGLQRQLLGVWHPGPRHGAGAAERGGIRRRLRHRACYNAAVTTQETTAILFQSALKEIGVNLQLKKIPASTFYNNVSERKQPMIFYYDSPWCPDPGYSMNLYFHSKSFINYSNYENARVDELIDDAAKTSDMDARLAMMDEVQQIVMREAPWVFVAFTNYSMARRSDIRGWTYYTSNNIRFQDFRREA